LSRAVGSYVDRAHAGETFTITRNGRRWARLLPATTTPTASTRPTTTIAPTVTGSDYLDRLIADGRVVPATGTFADLPDLPGPIV
jgi:antitoxin (DNA-binding transcriptional repressor) of toxin-antitoxin stability system